MAFLVLDLTVQGVHITNQTVIYRLHPDARNRLTAGYMTSYFIGWRRGVADFPPPPGNMPAGPAFVWRVSR
ncbi:transmembrane transport protein [Salmonella enterica subsp. enterica]|uniref:Transmembrane transport protein n=1 Tax=Salmonella enterica I TaxID=59201 RepID=A0A3S4K7M8_SALET|nr:transmembrane transport protein [Salmonella enterica subsp. enterica]